MSKTNIKKTYKKPNNYLELLLVAVMTFILSMPIFSYLMNRLIIYQRQDNLFIYGFFISAAICTALVICKFFSLILEHKHLRFSGIAKLIVTKNPEYLLFFIYIIWIFISICYNGFTQVNVFGLSFKREGLITFTLYTFVFFAASFIRKESYKNFLAFVFALGAIVLAILGVYVNLSADPMATGEKIMLSGSIGVFANYNHHGYYLAMTGTLMLALAVFLKSIVWRIIFFIGFVFTYIYVVFLTSIGALVSIEMGMGLVFIIYGVVTKGKKHKIIALAGLILTAALFIFITKADTPISGKTEKFVEQTQNVVVGQAEDHYGTVRWLLWKTTVEYIKEKPVFGWGSDGIWYKLQAVTNEAQRTHNEYLQQAAFYGIPAGLAYVLACFMIYWRAFRNRKTLRPCDIAFLSGAFAYLVGAFFGVTMVQVYPMFMAVLGLSVCENVEVPTKPSQKLDNPKQRK